MPAGLIKTKGDAKKWKRAKSAVAKARSKKQSEFTDLDWGLVTSIFKKMKGESIAGGSFATVDTRRWNLAALREALKVLRRSIGYKMRPQQ